VDDDDDDDNDGIGFVTDQLAACLVGFWKC